MLPPEAGHVFAILKEPLPQQVQKAQLLDEVTQHYLDQLKEAPNQENEPVHASLEERDGYLWFKAPGTLRLYVPIKVRPAVLNYYHDDLGHPGREETERAVALRYLWPELKKDVRTHVRRCLACAATKPGAARPPAPLQPRAPTSPWHTVSVDLMGPYPRTSAGKNHILVCTDVYTKWTEAFPIGKPQTSTIIRLLEDAVFSRFGYPKVILSDNGTQFVSNRWKRACENWGALSHKTGLYHPRANPVERRNQEIKKGLRLRMIGQPHTKWAKFLPEILRDLRTRKNAATGYSPSRALLGYELPLPGDRDLEDPDLECEAPEHDGRAARMQDINRHVLTYQRRYAGGPEIEPHQVGDAVMIRSHPKSDATQDFHAGFHPRWLGPYNIRELHSGRVYTVEKDGTTVRIPSYDIKPAPDLTPVEEEDDTDDEPDVPPALDPEHIADASTDQSD